MVSGGAAPAEAVGRAPLGIAADDGKDSAGPTPEPGGLSPRQGGRSLEAPLKISAEMVAELTKRGLLSPQLAALIASGRIVLEPHAGASARKPTTGPPRSFAAELNALRFEPPFSGGSSAQQTGFGASVAAPLPRSLVVGGYQDPLLGFVPPQTVTINPATSTPASKSWRERLAPSIKASFGIFEGLTIGDLRPAGVNTNISVSGVTQKLFSTKGGTAGQVELGWGKSVGLQISHRGHHVHGEVDTDGGWVFTYSFPGEAPMPVPPWTDDTFRQGAASMRSMLEIAASGETDPAKIVQRVKPHVDGIKNAIDAGKGIFGANPKLSVAAVVGSSPRPGAPEGAGASGVYVGGAFIVSF